MTDTALAPIDTSPMAFEAHLSGGVISTADHGAKFAVRSKGEVSKEDFLRLCELARSKQLGFYVFVPDAESMDEVTMPPKPKALPAGKKSLTPSVLQRLKIENIAREHGYEAKEEIEAYYQERMAKNNHKLDLELEDLRREKAYMPGMTASLNS